MSKVSETVLGDFYKRLAENDDVDKDVLAGLKAVFASEKKVRAEDLEAVLESVEKDTLP